MTALARTQDTNTNPARFLIGPRTYPAFQWMLQVSLLGLGAGCAIWFAWPLLGFVLQEGIGGPRSAAAVSFFVADLVQLIVGQSVLVLTEFVRTALATLGVLVIVFALVDRWAHADGEDPAAQGGRQSP
jgi:hypothetical protein